MKLGVFFCKEMIWGVFFCKKWTFPPRNETKLMLDLSFILPFYLFGRGAYTHPTHPPCLPAWECTAACTTTTIRSTTLILDLSRRQKIIFSLSISVCSKFFLPARHKTVAYMYLYKYHCEESASARPVLRCTSEQIIPGTIKSCVCLDSSGSSLLL